MFRLLGETGAHASVLPDVLRGADPALLADTRLPFAGGRWVICERCASPEAPGPDRRHDSPPAHRAPALDEELPLRAIDLVAGDDETHSPIAPASWRQAAEHSAGGCSAPATPCVRPGLRGGDRRQWAPSASRIIGRAVAIARSQ